MNFLQQIALISALCFLGGVLVFGLGRWRRTTLVEWAVAVLLGVLSSMVGHHFMSGRSRVESEAIYIWAFGIGFVIFWIFSKLLIRKNHVAHIHTHSQDEHAHEHGGHPFFHFSGVLPHSFFDGVIWGLSLGFNPSLNQEVFLFLMVHRVIETISWMGLFAKLSQRIYFGGLALVIALFALGAVAAFYFGVTAHTYKFPILILFSLSLGYMVASMLQELLERWIAQTPAFKLKWALFFGLGVAAAVFGGKWGPAYFSKPGYDHSDGHTHSH